MENTWLSSQIGYSVDFTASTAQSGNISVTDDIEFASNIRKNVDRGFTTLEQDYNCGTPTYPLCTNQGQVKRIWVHNNLILLSTNLDTTPGQHQWINIDGGDKSAFLGTTVGLTDFIFQHNTVLMIDGSVLRDFAFNLQGGGICNPPVSTTHNIWMLDNVIARQPIGTYGWRGTTGLGYYMGDPSPLAPRYLGNVMFVPSGDSVYTWPAHNDATAVPLTYVDPGNGDYQLLTPDWTDTTDGKISGIDWSELQSAMNN
jgi:hypothetical protein